jgi:branched-subunit amino acid transport protein
VNEVLLVAGMALVTFSVRYSVLVLVGRMPLPQPIVRALRFVPTAVLTAIIVPAVLLPHGDRIEVSFDNAYLVAALVAALVAVRSRNVLLTIVIGMLTLLVWRWILTLHILFS